MLPQKVSLHALLASDGSDLIRVQQKREAEKNIPLNDLSDRAVAAPEAAGLRL
jgi:hypothetical protein